MPGTADETLQVHRAIAKCRLGFALGTGELFAQLRGTLRQANTPSATTGRGLDQQGEAHLLGCRECGLDVKQLARRTRHHRHAGSLCGASRLGLVAHAADRLWAGPDKNRPGGLHRFGEVCVLREKAIAWVHCVGPGGFQGAQQGLDIQVAFVGAGRAEQVHFVGHARGLGVEVRLTARGNGWNAQFLGGADNPHGDFATVGDQQFSDALGHDRAPHSSSSVATT